MYFRLCLFHFFFFVFFFNDTATTEIYTLSLHDALPIFVLRPGNCPTLCQPFFGFVIIRFDKDGTVRTVGTVVCGGVLDRKSTRLNSSHANISYAVFCLKKKKLKIKKINTYIYNTTSMCD